MRSMRLAVATLMVLAVVGCKDEELTGPRAQAAFEEASAVAETIPTDVVIFVDGERIVDDGDISRVAAITGITSADVQRIEVLKGDAARKLVRDKPVRSVVRIYTGRTEP